MGSDHKTFHKMRSLSVLIAVLLLAGCASKNTWTANEIIEWHSKNVLDTPKLYSPLYYRGSDEKHHYFSIRAIDRWILMKVVKDEIFITDQKPLETYSSENYLGYYAVDPQNEFKKIEDQKK